MACSGTMKSFNQFNGFGFLTHNGTDIFVHKDDCVDGLVPQKGDTVAFDIADNPKKPGSKRATNVSGGTAPRKGIMGNGNCQGIIKSFDNFHAYGFVTHM